jgi:RNA polymerase sigma factor (sigma-70 family)
VPTSSLTSKSGRSEACAKGTRGLSNPVAERRFREIVPPLLDDAYTLAKWLSQSPTDAEDIVQDAALRALNALSTVSVDRPKPWFLAIVRNAAMTFMARNRRKTLSYVGDMADLDALDLPQGDDAAPDPEQTLIALEDGERLRQAVACLPSPFLETLTMRDINGLSYREIAEATEAPIGTVMSRLARARAMLARTLRTEQ